MTPHEWESANAQSLSDALAWLRIRFERFIAANYDKTVEDEERAPVHSPDAEEKPKRRRYAAPKIAAQRAKHEPLSLDHAPVGAPTNPSSGLAILGRLFGLTPFELDVLLLCVAFELDGRIAELCARAHNEPQRAYPTFALAMMLFDEPSWDVTTMERPLRGWHLIDVERRAALPLTLSMLSSDARTVDFVKGFNHIDERLSTFAVPLGAATRHMLSRSQSSVVDRIVAACARTERSESAKIQLAGADPQAKFFIASWAASLLARDTWRLQATWLPSTNTEIDELARLLKRESVLAPTLIVLDAQEVVDERDSETGRAVRRLLSRDIGDVLLVTRIAWPALNESSVAMDVEPPNASEQRAAWDAAIDGADVGDISTQLATQFCLDFSAIERVSNAVRAKPNDEPLAQRLWDECCLYLKPRLDSLAVRLDALATWDDIVLPTEQLAQLREIAQQVRGRYTVYQEWGFAHKMNRGLGISVLFAGDSGTGKTMAAEVIANDLRLPVYRIDLSAVVSKYIGETEKNLRQLFDAADLGGFVLLFDEADALFGKRSEVRDSHDRYANIEVNYLLQRIEQYNGLAILSTNAKTALDSAFVRRLRFIVNFPHPTATDRRRIWDRAFTVNTPVDNLGLDQLARLNATGGIIHNASLAAAFAAAARHGKVDMPTVLASVAAEYRKLNRPINVSDFSIGTKS
jgi:hypothetical protein